MFKKRLIPIILGLVLLLACQKNEEPEIDEDQDPSVEETTPTEEEETEEDEEQGVVDEPSEDEQKDIVKEEYPTEEEAAGSINRYHKVEQTNTDLGHGIQALSEGAAGHQYVSWNEGRWLIEIDFPLDPANAVDDYEDGESLAREIVEYLEEHRLPAPNKIGTISIRSMKEDPETLVKWQDGKTVYVIKKEVSNPIEAIKIATDYEEIK